MSHLLRPPGQRQRLRLARGVLRGEALLHARHLLALPPLGPLRLERRLLLLLVLRQ